MLFSKKFPEIMRKAFYLTREIMRQNPGMTEIDAGIRASVILWKERQS